MHETHLIKPVIKGISEHAQREGARKVTKVRLRVGRLAAHSEDSFKETFLLLGKNTPLEGCALELTFFPGMTVKVLSFDIE